MSDRTGLADELNLLAAELIGQQRNATIAGDGVCIRVRAPNALIRTLIRASEILGAEADPVHEPQRPSAVEAALRQSQSPDRDAGEGVRAELLRLSLVIESAVRNADPGNHAAVLALIQSARPLSPEGKPS